MGNLSEKVTKGKIDDLPEVSEKDLLELEE